MYIYVQITNSVHCQTSVQRACPNYNREAQTSVCKYKRNSVREIKKNEMWRQTESLIG